MTCREYIFSRVDVGVFTVSTFHTFKPRLAHAVFGGNVTTTSTSAACVARVYGYDHSAPPCLLIVQLAAELVPALIEDGFIQSRLGFYVLAVLFRRAFCACAHVGYLQILNHNDGVVFADCG